MVLIGKKQSASLQAVVCTCTRLQHQYLYCSGSIMAVLMITHAVPAFCLAPNFGVDSVIDLPAVGVPSSSQMINAENPSETLTYWKLQQGFEKMSMFRLSHEQSCAFCMLRLFSRGHQCINGMRR